MPMILPVYQLRKTSAWLLNSKMKSSTFILFTLKFGALSRHNIKFRIKAQDLVKNLISGQ